MNPRTIAAGFALALECCGFSASCSPPAATAEATVSASPSTTVGATADWKVAVTTPDVWVIGGRCEVLLALTASAEGSRVPGWAATAASFSVNGTPLAPHGEQATFVLAAGETREFALDLGPTLKAHADFDLAFASEPAARVRVLEPAPAGLKFMDEAATPLSALESCWVVLDTVRGTMVCEMYPAIAPNHVRNFLDLVASGFYDGTIFHRVLPGFMIQGGDPDGTGMGGSSRKVNAEFTRYKKHVKGILSMARNPDPNSASSQFFVMHGANPELDNRYSIFGNLVRGFSTLDKIVRSPGEASPRDFTICPKDQQVLVKATVVKRPANADEWREGPNGKPLKAPAAPAPAPSPGPEIK